MAGNNIEEKLTEARGRFIADLVLNGIQGIRPSSKDAAAVENQLAQARSRLIISIVLDQHQIKPDLPQV